MARRPRRSVAATARRPLGPLPPHRLRQPWCGAHSAGIPSARFEVMPGEAHQPFQEAPEEFDARVEAFWREVEARG